MTASDQLKNVMERAEALHRYLDMDQKEVKFEEEQPRTQAPNFWEDPRRAQGQVIGVKGIEGQFIGHQQARQLADELELVFNFYRDEMITENESDVDYAKAVTTIEHLEVKSILRQTEDPMDCVMKTNSGANGMESQD